MTPPSDGSPQLQENNRRRRSNEHLEDRQTTRRKKVKMFEGLTDAERRQLREDQRKLHATLEAEDYAQDENADGTTLDQVRDENNDLFKKVRWTRELVLDADNVDVLATKYAKQVEQKVQV
jgi:type II secretory pathway component PulC